MHFFLAAVLLSVAQPQDKSKEDPILRSVKDNLSDPTKPFTLLLRFKVKEGQGPKFEAAMGKAVKETRKDKGNLAYELSLSRSAKGSNYIIYERWENLAALEAHMKTAHFKTTATEIAPLLESAIDLELFVPVPLGN
jgi:quinol monooxygenase YgiN